MGASSFNHVAKEYDILIEFQGEQHYKEFKNHFKAAGGLEGIKERDEIKKKFGLLNNFNYIEISYKEFNQIKTILKNKICV